MSSAASQRDLLICQLAWERRWLSADQLEAAVQKWKQAPEASLLDVLHEAAELSAEQLEQLEDHVTRQAAETCVDPHASRLQALPAGVRSLLADDAPQHDLPTDNRFDTVPSDAGDAASVVGPAGICFPEDQRFEIGELHAQGGLGMVFVARDQQIDRSVALKQIKPQWADEANSRLRFLQEARITGRLEHPGIVPIYAIGSDSTGRPFYAMRFIRGDSLLEVLQRFHAKATSGRRSAAERMSQLRKLVQRFVDVCNTIEYAHSKGVLHRDIKPANIILGRFGETLVVDWGLAKVIGSEEEVSQTTRITWSEGDVVGSTPTRVGSAVGTPAYMSPEQAAGRPEELGPPADVYSLGATLYHLLTGALPHGQEQDVAVLMQRLASGGPRPPRQTAPWLPRPLEAICTKALAAEPQRRYRSPRALAEDLQRWLADEPVVAYGESFSERTWRWVRNHRALVASLTVAEIILAAAIAVGVIGWNHIQNERRQQEAADEQRSQQRLVEVEATVAGARRSAEAELRAGRFSAALGFVDAALAAVDRQPSFESIQRELQPQRQQFAKLASYYELGAQAEEMAFFQRDAEAMATLYQALETIGALDHGDWWDHLPSDALSPSQLDQLQQDVYRKLILLAAAYAKQTYKNLLSEAGAAAAREVLVVNQLVQRFRPAEATRWHASTARMRLGGGLPLRASELAAPQNAADAYMLGAIWVVGSQNPAIAAMIAPGDEGLLDKARRELQLVESLAPNDYWSHFLRAYVEVRAAGEPLETPPGESRPHYVAARRALGHCIAIKPDYWLAYAERSGACRREIESRRAADVKSTPSDWDSVESLRQIMIRDVMRARELAPQSADVRWYVAFALQTAGQTDAAIAEALEAIDLGSRFDVETTPRMVDPQRQRALPEVVQIATRLLEEHPDNSRYLLLRASANLQLRQYDQALSDIEAALAAPAPPPRAWTVRGWIRLIRQQQAEARADFQRALSALPQHPTSLIGLAHAHEARNDFETALSAFNSSLRNAVTDYQIAASELGRCRCLAQLGRWNDALAAITAGRAANPACEITSVLRIAREKSADEFATQLEQLTDARSVAERFEGGPPQPTILPLLNGGFELGLARHWNNDDVGGLAWHNTAGSQSYAEVVAANPRRGRFALHIAHASRSAPDAYGMTTQSIPVDPSGRFRLTLWASARSLTEHGVSVVIGDELDRPVVQLPGGTYDWTELSGEFTLGDATLAIREGLAAAAVRIISTAPGEAWIDEIRIERIGRADAAAASD